MKEETNQPPLEAQLRQFYETEYREMRTPDRLWEQLSKELDRPATPLPNPKRNNSMRDAKEVREQAEWGPLPNSEPLAPEPRFNRGGSRRAMVIATLVATIVIMVGLVIVAGYVAGNPNKNIPGSGGQVATATRVPPATPTIDLTAMANSANNEPTPTLVPTSTPLPYSSSACRNLSSLDCVFKASKYSQVVEKKLGQNLELSDAFNDYKVTIKRVYAGPDDSGGNQAIVIGYTINAPPYMSSLHRFHPEAVVLKDEQGNILKSSGSLDGEAQINEQGFIGYWQIPAGSSAKNLKLHLEISRIQLLGPAAPDVSEPPVTATPKALPNPALMPTPTPVPTPTEVDVAVYYIEHTFAFDFTVAIQ